MLPKVEHPRGFEAVVNAKHKAQQWKDYITSRRAAKKPGEYIYISVF